MDESLQDQLNKIENLLPKIERFADSRLMDIPDVFRKELSGIKIIPQFTAGGVESMISVLNSLYFAQYYAKKALKEEKPTVKKIEQTPTITIIKPKIKVPLSQDISSKTITSKKIMPAIINSPSPQKIEEKYRRESPLDFGPYAKKD